MNKRKVLIVEDVPLLAFEVCDIISDAAGMEIVGPANTVLDALKLISGTGCDVAVVDFNLGNESAEKVALSLQSNGTPLIFLSGYSQHAIPAEFCNVPLLMKPVSSIALMEAIMACLNSKPTAKQLSVAK